MKPLKTLLFNTAIIVSFSTTGYAATDIIPLIESGQVTKAQVEETYDYGTDDNAEENSPYDFDGNEESSDIYDDDDDYYNEDNENLNEDPDIRVYDTYDDDDDGVAIITDDRDDLDIETEVYDNGTNYDADIYDRENSLTDDTDLGEVYDSDREVIELEE